MKCKPYRLNCLQPSVQLPVVEEKENSNPIVIFFQNCLMTLTSQHTQLLAIFGALSVVTYLVYKYSKSIEETKASVVKESSDYNVTTEITTKSSVQEQFITKQTETLVHRKPQNDNVPINDHEEFTCTCPIDTEYHVTECTVPNSLKKTQAPKAPELEKNSKTLLENISESSTKATVNNLVTEIGSQVTEKAEETLHNVVDTIQTTMSQVAECIDPVLEEIEREVNATLEDHTKSVEEKLVAEHVDPVLETIEKKLDEVLEDSTKCVEEKCMNQSVVAAEVGLGKRFSIESLKIEQKLAPEVAKEMSPPAILEREASHGCMKTRGKLEKNNSLLELYSAKHVNAIEDHFDSLNEIASAIKTAGLEKSQLIFGIDFTISNLENGTNTFNGRSLHYLDDVIKNPYQKVIEIVGKTLEKFDMDGKIPAFGFGDSKTKDRRVFPFSTTGFCQGFKDVLEKYDKLLPTLQLSGPTNFAPLIKESIRIVKSTKQYHILVIVADGQVTNERQTREAIVEASKYPISIIMVGVGDGPWGTMNEFDDSLPKRQFDNFQFVNYHEVTRDTDKPDEVFALHTLMEIPDQYKAIKDLNLLD